MAVGLEHPPDTEVFAQFEQLFVFVGRIDQHRITAGATAHDEHIVLERAHHGLVDLDIGVTPVQCRRRRAVVARRGVFMGCLIGLAHGPSLAEHDAAGTRHLPVVRSLTMQRPPVG